jgi:hypothetical protein
VTSSEVEDGDSRTTDSTIIQTLARFVTSAFSLLGEADTPETAPSTATTVFPRLRLDDGVEMPGNVPLSEWKEPKPDWKLEWRGDEYDGRVFGVKGWERTE